MGNNLISVCIPTYNRKEFLVNAIKSVLNQSYKNFEILIVDDGSDYDIEGFIKRYFSDSRIRFFRNSKNMGRPYTRNRCIEKASGDYILWLDDDDTINPYTLENYKKIIENYPDGDVFYGNINVLNSTRLSFIRALDFYKKRIELFQGLTTEGCYIPNPGTLVKKDIYKKYGNYDLELKRAQDYELWIRISLFSNFKKLDYTVANYYVHKGNVSNVDENSSFVDSTYESYAVRKNLNYSNIEYIHDKLTRYFWKLNDTVNTLFYSLFFENSSMVVNTLLRMDCPEKAVSFETGKESVSLYRKLSQKLIKAFNTGNLTTFERVSKKLQDAFGNTWIVSYYYALLFKEKGNFELAKKYANLSLRLNPFSQESKSLLLELGMSKEEIDKMLFRILFPLNYFEKEKSRIISQILDKSMVCTNDYTLYST